MMAFPRPVIRPSFGTPEPVAQRPRMVPLVEPRRPLLQAPRTMAKTTGGRVGAVQEQRPLAKFAPSLLSPVEAPRRSGRYDRTRAPLARPEGQAVIDMGATTHSLYTEMPVEGTWMEDRGVSSLAKAPLGEDFGQTGEDDTQPAPPTVGAGAMDFDFASIAKAAIGPGVTYMLKDQKWYIAVGGGLLAAWAANKFLFGA